ncbi:UDP-galactose:fucoside alpha-3-galactosyltransferase-like [Acanthaster planci]|uniref:UDP-galactose:fucoside alpha-3-galactosyltransferase-like n=1 Tax=Acanthaster planci TaxID=133434 RepID=A0A8B7YBJ5_ACAPL|nr:UDP-galactose:fucoside alpha-3-galactosyltransferase-like [Acanthaster planci]
MLQKFLVLSLLSTFIISIINYYQPPLAFTPTETSNGYEMNKNDPEKSPDAASGGTEARGRLSDCTLAEVAERTGVVILTTTNTAFLDMTLNMFESIKRLRLCINATIIAEDQRVYEYLHQLLEGDPGIHVLKTNSGEMGEEELDFIHNRPKYYGLMNKRQAYILTLLEQGLEVLFTDTDTYWFRDPLPYFHGDFDMYMVDLDAYSPRRNKGPARINFCAGFVHFKPTKETLRFVEAWIQTMTTHQRRGQHIPDQVVMNDLLRERKPVRIKVQPLDSNLFPWGERFYEMLAQGKNYPTVVMHAATIRGHKAKVEKFRSSGMWLVSNTSEELLNLGV